MALGGVEMDGFVGEGEDAIAGFGIFGDGVVLNFEGNGPQARIQVNFEGQGTKWLMLSYANLEVV